MSIDSGISIAGFVATIVGLILILYQVRAARRDTLTGSFVSSISEHWKSIEERRLQLRSGQVPAYYPTLFPHLEKLLHSKYKGDLQKLAKGHLPEYAQKLALGKEAVFQAIANEYAYQDIIFNFYEEEYIAAWKLKLVDKKLKTYWMWYMQDSFASRVKQNHWKLRKILGRTYPPFFDFVEKELIHKKQVNTGKRKTNTGVM